MTRGGLSQPWNECASSRRMEGAVVTPARCATVDSAMQCAMVIAVALISAA